MEQEEIKKKDSISKDNIGSNVFDGNSFNNSLIYTIKDLVSIRDSMGSHILTRPEELSLLYCRDQPGNIFLTDNKDTQTRRSTRKIEKATEKRILRDQSWSLNSNIDQSTKQPGIRNKTFSNNIYDLYEVDTGTQESTSFSPPKKSFPSQSNVTKRSAPSGIPPPPGFRYPADVKVSHHTDRTHQSRRTVDGNLYPHSKVKYQLKKNGQDSQTTNTKEIDNNQNYVDNLFSPENEVCIFCNHSFPVRITLINLFLGTVL